MKWSRVDRKWLYMHKKGYLGGGGFRPCPLKIDTPVDEDIECQSWHQIRKGSIKGLKNEKAKWHRKNYLTGPLSRGWGFWTKNLVARRQPRGKVISQGGTCISYRVLYIPGKKFDSQRTSIFKLILLPTPCCYGLHVTWNSCTIAKMRYNWDTTQKNTKIWNGSKQERSMAVTKYMNKTSAHNLIASHNPPLTGIYR